MEHREEKALLSGRRYLLRRGVAGAQEERIWPGVATGNEPVQWEPVGGLESIGRLRMKGAEENLSGREPEVLGGGLKLLDLQTRAEQAVTP